MNQRDMRFATWAVFLAVGTGCSSGSSALGEAPGEGPVSPALRGTSAAGARAVRTIDMLRALPQFSNHLGDGRALEYTDSGFHPSARSELAAQRRGTWSAAGGALDVVLPAHARAPMRLALENRQELWLEVIPDGVDDVAGEPVHGAVVLSDAGRDMDVVHVAESNRAEEIRLLRSARAGTSAHYTLRTGPAVREVRVVVDRIELTDSAGRARIASEPLFVVDANHEQRVASASVSGGGDTWKLTVSFDAAGLAYPIAMDPVWTASATTMSPLFYTTNVVLLDSGELFCAGGGSASESPTSAVALYDPNTDTWASPPPQVMPHKRPTQGQFMVRLTNGDVLWAGGGSPQGSSTAYTADVYHASSGVWTSTKLMAAPHDLHVTMPLPGGKAMVIGGTPGGTEVYDPATNGWTAGKNPAVNRTGLSAVTLKDGRILIAGGTESPSGVPQSSAEIYDPNLDQWSSAGNMSRYHYDGLNLVVLPSGNVLAAGGWVDQATPAFGNDADIYDPVANKWTPAAPMLTPRRVFPLVVLPTGKALAVNLVPELYDEDTNTWTATEPQLFQNWDMGIGMRLSDGRAMFVHYSDGKVEFFKIALLGENCTDSTDCDSGFCSDGVCCNSGCFGQCEACNLPNKAGTCSPVTGTPKGGRKLCTTDSTACGGACDGIKTTACTYPGAATQCRDASCTAGVATLAANCVGNGKCPNVSTQPCGGFACEGTTCGTTCDADAKCATGYYCSGTSCVAKLALGKACTANNQCLSDSCADGICCESACNGQCEMCGAGGLCAAVTGAPQGGRQACADDKSGCGGKCDGTNRAACTYPGVSTQCRDPSCANDVATLAAVCDGAGACPLLVTKDCSPLHCNGNTCFTNCANDGQCQSGNYCDLVTVGAGICRPKLAPPSGCTSANMCTSGFCVDGVCCDGACSGQCEACNVSGKIGTCSPVKGPPQAPRPICGSDGTACGGQCDGTLTTACVYPDSATQCRAPSCSSGAATFEAFCSGTGSCPLAQKKICAPYVCGTDKCNGDCASTTDCQSGKYCAAGVCEDLLQDGANCSAPDSCQSGICVDGVCCDKACTGQCEACNLAGSNGVCTTVKSGVPRSGRSACAGTGTCGATCDGTSATECTYPGAQKICAPGNCSGNTATGASACDGNGACTTATDTDCGAYRCLAGACTTTCTGALDCAPGNVCTSSGTCEKATNVGGAGGVAGAGGVGAAGGVAGAGGAGAGGVASPGTGTGGGAGTGTGTGTGGAVDGGVGNAGSGTKFDEPVAKDDSGCGCRTVSSRGDDSALMLGVLAGLAISVRRSGRRRRSSGSKDCFERRSRCD